MKLPHSIPNDNQINRKAERERESMMKIDNNIDQTIYIAIIQNNVTYKDEKKQKATKQSTQELDTYVR